MYSWRISLMYAFDTNCQKKMLIGSFQSLCNYLRLHLWLVISCFSCSFLCAVNTNDSKKGFYFLRKMSLAEYTFRLYHTDNLVSILQYIQLYISRYTPSIYLPLLDIFHRLWVSSIIHSMPNCLNFETPCLQERHAHHAWTTMMHHNKFYL